MGEQAQKKTCNRWIILAVIYLACISASFNLLKVGPVLSLLITQFGISSSTAGFIISSTSIAGMVLVFPAASIVRKMGGLKVGLSVLALFIIGNLIGYLSTNLAVLIIGRVIEGIGMGMTGVTSSTIINTHFTGKSSKIAMAIWSTWFPVGGAFANLFSAKLAYQIGYGNWKTVWLFSMIELAVVFILYAFIVREKPNPWGNQGSSEKQPNIYVSGLSNPKVWFTGLSFMALMISNVGFLSWATTFYSDNFGMDSTAGGALSSYGYWFSMIGGVVASLIAGFFVKTDEKKGLNASTLYEHVALIACSLAATIIYPLGCVWPQNMQFLYLVLIGLINGYACAVIFAAIPRDSKAPHLIGVTFAIIFFSQNVGAFVANPVMGKVIGEYGNYQWTNMIPYLLIVNIIGLACSVIACLIKVKKLDGPWNRQGGWEKKDGAGDGANEWKGAKEQ